MKFTQRSLKQTLKPKSSRYEKIDDTGLGAVVRSNGSISWQIRFMMDGKRYRKTYGTVSLEEARESMRKDRELIASGENPVDVINKKIAAEREKPTLKELLERYNKEYLEKNLKRPEQPRMLIKRYIIPKLGKISADKITRLDISRILTSITNDGKNVTANRVLSATKAFFDWIVVIFP